MLNSYERKCRCNNDSSKCEHTSNRVDNRRQDDMSKYRIKNSTEAPVFSINIPKNVLRGDTKIFFDESTFVLTIIFSLKGEFEIKTKKVIDFKPFVRHIENLYLKDVYFSEDTNKLYVDLNLPNKI